MKKIKIFLLAAMTVFANFWSMISVYADQELPDLKIAKIDVGEGIIEIYNSSNQSVDLNGIELYYYGASKDDPDLPSRLIDSVIDSQILEGFKTVTFKGSLAKSGGAIGLFLGEELLDLVGWGSAKLFDGKKVSSKASSSGIFGRCIDSDGLMTDEDNNAADFGDAHGLEPGRYAICEVIEDNLPARPDDGLSKDCSALKINEIGANMEYDRQFVELKNVSSQSFNLSECQIATTKSKISFVLGDLILGSGELVAISPYSGGLKLVKTTTDTVFVLSSDGTEVDEKSYSNLKSGTSWALIDGVWAMTYSPTPDEENVFALYPPCQSGYERNLLTGRCNKTSTSITKSEKVCAEDQILNPLTNRCKKVEVKQEKICKEGEYLNPETNRCRKIAVEAGTAPCAEGYERNPETNRCRKTKVNLGAGYSVDGGGKTEDNGSLMAIICLIVIGVAGIGYLVFAFRVEIWQFLSSAKEKVELMIKLK